MPTCRIFLEIAQIKIHQLVKLSFFPTHIRLSSSPVVKQINSLVYNIKYTYLLAFCSPVGKDFPRTLYPVQCWTGANGSSLNEPSVLQIQFLCDKTRYISQVINFIVMFSLHRFSWLIPMHHYIPSKLVNINLPTPTSTKGDKFSFV